jgi:DNA-binding transcriptional MocR family regulator
VPVRPLPSSAGLHVAALVDDGGDDRALHEASVTEDVIVASLRRCYRFTRSSGGILVGFGSMHDAQFPDALDAIDRVLLHLHDRVHRTQAS